MTETVAPRRTLFRKNIVVPTEHGGWSWLSVPFLAGALVGAFAGAPAAWAGLALILTLLGGLTAYMIRQPATAWARIRSGRGRRADEPLALGWALGFSAVALLCLLGLLALGRNALVLLTPAFLVVLVMYLLAARSGRAAMRALSMELTGAVGLALMAPAAYVAVTGVLDSTAWILWGLLALQNATGVLYVRVRLADTHRRPAERTLLMAGHAAALLLVAAGALAGFYHWAAVVPFVGFLARAIWTFRAQRPVPNVKRFGFTEIGVELLGGALIALGLIL